MDFTKLVEKAGEYLPPEKITVVEDAHIFAAEKHQGQQRLSGEPYLEHPMQTALTLAEFQLDASTLAAGLLHDIPEDCGLPIAEIEAKFGKEIAKLVDGVTKLDKLSLTASGVKVVATQAENLKKMLITMAEDLRVVFIKLADRLHNMHTLDALPPERQYAVAQETMEIYAPLANVLGIWEWKNQLEDLAFRYVHPQDYKDIAEQIASRRVDREKGMQAICDEVGNLLSEAGIEAEVGGRPKHLYSIYRKMDRKDVPFEQVYDIRGVRILVNSESDCYLALGAIHNRWKPVPGTFAAPWAEFGLRLDRPGEATVVKERKEGGAGEDTGDNEADGGPRSGNVVDIRAFRRPEEDDPEPAG